MGMSAYDPRVDQRGSGSRAAIAHGIGEDRIAVNRIGPVTGADQEMWNAVQEVRDVAAGCLHLGRHADRVAVVLDEKEDRRLARGRGADRLPEFTFARSAFAARDTDDLVAVSARDPPLTLEIQNGLGAADGMKEVHAGRRRA